MYSSAMGETHPTTTPSNADMSKKAMALVKDLQGRKGVENARRSMFASSGVVVQTDDAGLRADVVRTIAEHNGRIGAHKTDDEPFEVFIE